MPASSLESITVRLALLVFQKFGILLLSVS